MKHFSLAVCFYDVRYAFRVNLNSEKLPKYQETPCSKPTQYLKIKGLEQGFNPQPFTQTGQITMLCC